MTITLAAPVDVSRRVVQGDTVLIPVTVVGYDGAALDLTTWDLAGAVKQRRSDASVLSTATVNRSGGPYADDDTTGQITFEFSRAATADWPVGTIQFEGQVVSSEGREHTVVEGRFEVVEEVAP